MSVWNIELTRARRVIMAVHRKTRSVSRMSVVIPILTVLAVAILAQNAVALDYRAPSPIYSYFEGLRGRLPLSTGATTDDPTALWINPALLGTGKAGGFAYLHTYNDTTFSGEDAFSLGIGALAFGAELYDLRHTVVTPQGTAVSSQSTKRYTIATGSRIGRNFFVGSSYSWHTSENADVDRGESWSIGGLLRPHRKLSIGFVCRDLNSPQYFGTKFKPIYETSLGIRPINDRLTVFANWTARTDKVNGSLPEEQPKSFVSYGLEYAALDGLTLRLGADQDENLSASILFSIGTGSLGTVFSREPGEGEEDDRSYGATILTTSPWWRESVLLPPNKYMEIHLSGEIRETWEPFSLLGGGGRGFLLRDLLENIEQAKNSRDVRAILLRCGGVGGSFAVFDELRQAILDFRKSGKAVIAYVENPGNGVYYLATACDYIVLQPNGYVGLVGLKLEGLFLRGTLDKLGMKAHYARVGKYKSAVEPLTEDEFTDPVKEARNALLDDVFDKMVDDIASGRGFSAGEVRDIIDRGPFVPTEALREGLVDTLAYWDEVPDIVNRLAGRPLGKLGYGRFSKRKVADSRWDEPPVIGIVYGIGGITHGSNRRDLWIGDILGSETTMAALRAMREDRSVDAVVFRVDSPGGMMTASDKIRREVKLTAEKKPVIVSMGGLAASGGYHISCDGTMILADEATVTGSIGVLNLWLHTRGFYEKIGANKEIFMRGEHADIFPSWREVTDEDLELAQYYVDKYYDKFVRDVAEGRAMSIDEVRDIAQGRVWSGKRAQELGLVDRIGGLTEAIGLAKREAGIPPGEEVNFKILPKPGGFLGNLTRAMGASAAREIEIPPELRELVGDAVYFSAYDDPILYLMPYQVEIR
jgi:protease-4